MTNVLAELGELHLSRPRVDAPPAEVARWHERRAVVLDHLAAQGSPAVAPLAEAAHRHARELEVAA